MTFAFLSCVDERDMDIVNDEADVPIVLQLMPFTSGDVGTRLIGDVEEGLGNDYVVHDFWLFQFDGNGNRVGTAKYYEVSDAELDQESGTVNTVVSIISGQGMQYYVLANTYDENFSISSSNTQELANAYLSIDSLDDLYVHIRDNEGNSTEEGALMMNGIASYDDSGNLLCELFRNVAKVVLTISCNEQSGVELLSAQVRNVPMAVYYFDFMHSDNDNFPIPADVGFGDFAKVDLNQDESELTFYLPRNRKSSSDAFLPDNSTYIELIGQREAGLVRYRFPFTADEENYDVLPNHLYHFNITIDDAGDFDADNRVEDLSVKALPESNSYIINPSPTTFKVPLTRVNRFWALDSPYMINYDAYDGGNMLSEDTKWVVEVIWQDVSEKVIEFVSAEGVGNNSFSFRTTSLAEDRTSNVLVGVRMEGRSEYLWSWHLWITPYNPDESEDWTWKDDVYTYPVTGGEVHRYLDREPSGVWNTIYWDKFIMDRNLGAASADKEDGTSTFGMYYQFGRKDPFPRGGVGAVVYASDGEKKSLRGKEGQDFIYSTVLAPDRYVWHASLSDWVIEDDKVLSEGRVWNDNTLLGSSNLKSIFDPCPPGWKLPKMGTFKRMVINGKPNVSEDQLQPDGGFPYGYEFYLSDDMQETAFFPFTGYLTRGAGSLYRDQAGSTGLVYGYQYYDTQYNYNQGNNFLYRYNNKDDSDMIAGQGSVTKNVAYPVRCIQE